VKLFDFSHQKIGRLHFLTSIDVYTLRAGTEAKHKTVWAALCRHRTLTQTAGQRNRNQQNISLVCMKAARLRFKNSRRLKYLSGQCSAWRPSRLPVFIS